MSKESSCETPLFFLLYILFGTQYAYTSSGFCFIPMNDVDFIRLSTLVFATRLTGITKDPVNEAVEMAERLFNKLKEKEVE